MAGHLTKAEVRRIAAEAGLHVADKKGSTGICFIGKRPFGEFIGQYVEPRRGDAHAHARAATTDAIDNANADAEAAADVDAHYATNADADANTNAEANAKMLRLRLPGRNGPRMLVLKLPDIATFAPGHGPKPPQHLTSCASCSQLE